LSEQFPCAFVRTCIIYKHSNLIKLFCPHYTTQILLTNRGYYCLLIHAKIAITLFLTIHKLLHVYSTCSKDNHSLVATLTADT